jgi:hypothetical protein
MAVERKGLIKFAGIEQTVVGEDIKFGQKVPESIIQKQDRALAPTNDGGPNYHEALEAAHKAL